MMKNPVHPGAVLREDVVTALGISAAETARRLKMPARSLRRVLHEAAPIDVDLAVKLEQAGMSTALVWLTMQTRYDLALARKRAAPHRSKLAV